jgi:transposase-like protein
VAPSRRSRLSARQPGENHRATLHLIRNSLAFVSWKDCKAILPVIKAIYRAENAELTLG